MRRESFYVRIRDGGSGLAVLDTTDYYGKGRYITRVNVPTQHRGHGHGREVLRQCLEEADATGTTLWTELSPYSDSLMREAELYTWLSRRGFRWFGGVGGVLVRPPQ